MTPILHQISRKTDKFLSKYSISQKKLASYLNISEGHLSQFLNGTKSINDFTVSRLLPVINNSERFIAKLNKSVPQILHFQQTDGRAVGNFEQRVDLETKENRSYFSNNKVTANFITPEEAEEIAEKIKLSNQEQKLNGVVLSQRDTSGWRPAVGNPGVITTDPDNDPSLDTPQPARDAEADVAAIDAVLKTLQGLRAKYADSVEKAKVNPAGVTGLPQKVRSRNADL